MYENRYGDEATEGAHPEVVTHLEAAQALRRLRAGNEAFLAAEESGADTSAATVRALFEAGQAPYACIVACADSRVVPEHVFMAGLGELFCVRVAGNVVDDMELASCLYAAEHLRVPLVLVLGHTHCGAIEAAIEFAEQGAAERANGPTGGDKHEDATSSADGKAGEGVARTIGDNVGEAVIGAAGEKAHESAIAPLVSRIAAAIGDERDPYAASVANVKATVGAIERNWEIAQLVAESRLQVHGAVYHTHSGVVDFL